MIYYCKSCKEFVAEDDATRVNHTEFHSEVDTRQYEEWSTYHCPHCGAELTEEATECRCGNPMRYGEYLCRDCYAAVEEEWRYMIERLTTILGEDVEDYVGDYVESIW